MGALPSVPASAFEPASLPRLPVPVYHIVQAQETLFSISKNFNTPVDSLRFWNQLTSNDLAIDEQLIVGYRIPGPDEALHTKDNDANAPQAPRPLPGFQLEKGIGATIPLGKDDTPSKQLYALHPSARKGSYIRVRNPSNGLQIVAKVIGELSAADQEKKIIVRLNQTASDAIGLINERDMVEVSYNK